jgi:hypothetical protein
MRLAGYFTLSLDMYYYYHRARVTAQVPFQTYNVYDHWSEWVADRTGRPSVARRGRFASRAQGIHITLAIGI